MGYKSKKCQLTVLMSVRNNADTLVETMDSLFAQTYKNFYLLVVDDASTDETLGILKRYADRNDNLTIITRSKPKGLAFNLNEMLSMAKTDYVARMDGDDVCYPDRFEAQMSFLQGNPDIDILGTAAHIINEHGERSGRLCWPEKHEDIIESIWCNPMIHPSIVMKRQPILNIGGYPKYKRKQDYALWFRCVKAGLKFHNLQKAYIQYRIVKRHYKKTTLKYALLQIRIGWAGYASIGGYSPKAYAMMAWPLFRTMLPSRVQRRMQKILRRFDPRRRQKVKR